MIKSKRIGDLAFNKATYIGKEPKNPSYHIDCYYPNDYYGKEEEFTKIDNEFYVNPKYPNYKIHENCFKHKEISIAIASFAYDKKEEYYEFGYISDRPLRYVNIHNERIFKELIKYGFKQLNPFWYA